MINIELPTCCCRYQTIPPRLSYKKERRKKNYVNFCSTSIIQKSQTLSSHTYCLSSKQTNLQRNYRHVDNIWEWLMVPIVGGTDRQSDWLSVCLSVIRMDGMALTVLGNDKNYHFRLFSDVNQVFGLKNECHPTVHSFGWLPDCLSVYPSVHPSVYWNRTLGVWLGNVVTINNVYVVKQTH